MMKIFLLLISAYLVVAFIFFVVFICSSGSKYALGFRIQKITLNNGKYEFRIQQKVPFLFIWTNIVRSVGIERYETISFDTEAAARKRIEDIKKNIAEEKGYKIRKRENIRP